MEIKKLIKYFIYAILIISALFFISFAIFNIATTEEPEPKYYICYEMPKLPDDINLSIIDYFYDNGNDLISPPLLYL